MQLRLPSNSQYCLVSGLSCVLMVCPNSCSQMCSLEIAGPLKVTKVRW